MEEYSVCNKFMKKEVYIKTINSINSFYLNQYIIHNEDELLNFMLYKTAKSLFFLKVIGYYYIRSSISLNIKKISELYKKFHFINLKLIFEHSKNKKYEKDMCNYRFSKIITEIKNFKLLSSNINNLYIYKNIIDIYLNNKFITYDNKNILKNIKIKLKKYLK